MVKNTRWRREENVIKACIQMAELVRDDGVQRWGLWTVLIHFLDEFDSLDKETWYGTVTAEEWKG